MEACHGSVKFWPFLTASTTASERIVCNKISDPPEILVAKLEYRKIKLKATAATSRKATIKGS